MRNLSVLAVILSFGLDVAAASSPLLVATPNSPPSGASPNALPPPPPPFLGCTTADIQGKWRVADGTLTIPSNPAQTTAVSSCSPTTPFPYPLTLNATGFSGGTPSGPPGCELGSTLDLKFSGSCRAAIGTLTNIYGVHPVSANWVGTAADISIVLVSPPAGGKYLITDAPEMPLIKARAQVVGPIPNPTATTTFTWGADLNAIRRSGALVPYSSYVVQSAQTLGASDYTLSFTNASALFGGRLALTAKAIADTQLTVGQKDSLEIQGTNPQRTVLRNQIDTSVDSRTFSELNLSDVKDTLKRIACQESKQAQFVGAPDGGTGSVLLSSDGNDGVGIFQITTAVTPLINNPQVAFNWRNNVNAGASVFVEKAKAARIYPAKLRMSKSYREWIGIVINQARCNAGLQPIGLAIVPQEPVDTYAARCLSTLSIIPGDAPAPDFDRIGVIGTSPTNRQLEDAVRAFNGYGGPPPPFGGVLHEFTPDKVFLETVPDTGLGSLHQNPNVWRRVLPSERGTLGDPQYVQRVTMKQATCPQ